MANNGWSMGKSRWPWKMVYGAKTFAIKRNKSNPWRPDDGDINLRSPSFLLLRFLFPPLQFWWIALRPPVARATAWTRGGSKRTNGSPTTWRLFEHKGKKEDLYISRQLNVCSSKYQTNDLSLVYICMRIHLGLKSLNKAMNACFLRVYSSLDWG